MNVLSLFDGMSGAQLALDRAGIEVTNYYASEIDKYAINITQKNFPNTIQMGSVTELTDEELKSLNIDLLTGGSPCQGFSVAGHMKGMSTTEGVDITSLEQYLKLKADGFEFDGQSYLFWEFIRVMHVIKPRYFLLENVRVQDKWKKIFDEVVGVEPIMINSALLSAQNRVRYYWTNIPNTGQPVDKGIVLKDVLESGEGCLVGKQGKVVLKDNIDKSACLLARDYKGFGNQGMTAARETKCLHIGDAADINGHDSLKRVYHEDGKSPAINTCQGGNRQVKVLCGASRGRYLVDGKRQDGKMLTAGKTKQYIEVRGDEKTNCLTTVQKDNVVTDADEAGRYETEEVTYRKLTPLEYERLQTAPDGYTEGVSNSQRYKMLGNGFTIDVIAYLLKEIQLEKA